ncbi:hypothetical protein KSP39_PZI022269 [Platanthera zijinensis]|uniref:Protein ABA DEFICIENT 4, chloroplastic-like n=1 Tax=Platanthera zijinensis TaxID=2320716 RepID=A0AAP0FUI3_9ASPA
MHLLCCSQISPPQQYDFGLRNLITDIRSQRMGVEGSKIAVQWSFLGGSKFLRPRERRISNSTGFVISAAWIKSSLIAASNAFTWGTVAVLPFYALMVFLPRSTFTRRAMKSNVPYVVLGLVYAYLLYLSWTPNTFSLMFASKYWLPELSGISKMFLNEMTMASAWIHLLAVDLHAARHIFYDGRKNNVETRHSVFLCLLFCPLGILVHAITKLLTKTVDHSQTAN